MLRAGSPPAVVFGSLPLQPSFGSSPNSSLHRFHPELRRLASLAIVDAYSVGQWLLTTYAAPPPYLLTDSKARCYGLFRSCGGGDGPTPRWAKVSRDSGYDPGSGHPVPLNGQLRYQVRRRLDAAGIKPGPQLLDSRANLCPYRRFPQERAGVWEDQQAIHRRGLDALASC